MNMRTAGKRIKKNNFFDILNTSFDHNEILLNNQNFHHADFIRKRLNIKYFKKKLVCIATLEKGSLFLTETKLMYSITDL